MPVPQFDPGIIGIELACPDMDFGMAQGEVFDDAGHQASRHRAEHAHGQFDCQCVADLLDRALRVAFRGQQYLGVFEEDPANLGQDDASASTFEYWGPDVLLKRPGSRPRGPPAHRLWDGCRCAVERGVGSEEFIARACWGLDPHPKVAVPQVAIGEVA